jgi:hypothetical protein
MITVKILNKKPSNFVAKDLLSPKYKMRVAVSKKKYNRQQQKSSLQKEVYG